MPESGLSKTGIPSPTRGAIHQGFYSITMGGGIAPDPRLNHQDKFAGLALSFLNIFARLDYGWFDD
jgi:hypothetical protein